LTGSDRHRGESLDGADVARDPAAPQFGRLDRAIGRLPLRLSRILVSLAMCALFFAAIFASKQLGDTDILSPALAAWLPVLVFGPLAFCLKPWR